MDQVSKRRGRPLPGARSNIKPIIFNLEEALAVENLYIPNLLVIQHDIPGEVALKSRDSVVHLLRYLKVWFDVPEKVYFIAVTYLDLFITRMKVQEKYLKCVAFACFYLALCREDINITILELVTISQSNFGIPDVLRMANIIREKLKLQTKSCKITTSADLLKIYLKFLGCASASFGGMLDQRKLLTRLEVLMADSSCAFFRPSTLAFTLLRLEIDRQMTNTIYTTTASQIAGVIHTFALMRELQLRCKVKSSELVNCSKHSSKVLKQYDSEESCINNRYLIWENQSITHKVHRLRSCLDVIKEKQDVPIGEKILVVEKPSSST